MGKRLLKFLAIFGVGKIGPDKVDDEIRRITRYDEWHNLVDVKLFTYFTLLN
jgi:hypothetical protein